MTPETPAPATPQTPVMLTVRTVTEARTELPPEGIHVLVWRKDRVPMTWRRMCNVWKGGAEFAEILPGDQWAAVPSSVAPAAEASEGHLYAKGDRDIESFLSLYMRHVEAMTAEKLHDKSHIAAELAWRDARFADCEHKRRGAVSLCRSLIAKHGGSDVQRAALDGFATPIE